MTNPFAGIDWLPLRLAIAGDASLILGAFSVFYWVEPVPSETFGVWCLLCGTAFYSARHHANRSRENAALAAKFLSVLVEKGIATVVPNERGA